jgi:transketolase
MNCVTKNLRKKILETSYKNQAGHIPSAYSILEIIFLLYKKFLSDDDVFVLSKGHGCLALYAVFLHMGFITEKEFLSFTQYDSKLGGHPHRNKHEKIYASTGSLGHGLPICVGSALAKKINKSSGKVFCLVGDGECNEGTTWEAAMIAENLCLNNLVCIVDNNKSQVRSLPTKKLVSKFLAFGWHVVEVSDGHNIEELSEVFQNIQNINKPISIICNTTKGKGIKEMEENMFQWHHGPPNKEQYKRFSEELSA